ncbi:MAG: WHG domain-containing protein [Oxalobacteraceae bacterium]|nr:MAG: WHG domain-containing protein [Oxalobacteraceae bacterium]
MCALANPDLFHLISTSSEQLQATGEVEALRMLRANAAGALPRAAASGEAETSARWAWSLIHGLAILMLDGQLPAEDQLIVTLITG